MLSITLKKNVDHRQRIFEKSKATINKVYKN